MVGTTPAWQRYWRANGASEFFGILRLAGATGRAKIPAGDMTGADLWELLSRPFPLLDAMVTAGLRTAEMIYPFGGWPVHRAGQPRPGDRASLRPALSPRDRARHGERAPPAARPAGPP